MELLVAITLFTIIMLAATSIFKMVIDGQRNSVSAQNVQENIRYIMERISKEIRMAKISNHDCDHVFSGAPGNATNKVYNLKGTDNNILYFMNKDSVCIAYFLESDRLKIRYKRLSPANAFEDFVTPENTIVSNLKFIVVDDPIGALPSVQPYVTMVMDIEADGLAMHKQKMKIQFTVSSRYYE